MPVEIPLDARLLMYPLLLLAGGVLAVKGAREPERRLFARGMGFVVLGSFVMRVGGLLFPLPQLAGFVLAVIQPRNARSRWGPYLLGVLSLIVLLMLERTFD